MEFWPFAVAMIAAFLLGFSVANKIDRAEINNLNKTIVTYQVKSEEVLKESAEKLKEANEKADNLNNQLETSYEQNISTINAYFDKLRSSRKTSGSDAMPECKDTGTFEKSSTDFAEIAYKIEVYAVSCWEFVTNKCGIKDDSTK